ncbi:hypothetical protein PFMG_03710, partial [Plasmodium falciparum IGH-CR14]
DQGVSKEINNKEIEENINKLNEESDENNNLEILDEEEITNKSVISNTMNMVELKNENKNEMMINDIKKEEEISAQIVEPVKKRGRKKGSKFVHKNITNEHILSQLKEPKRKGRKRKIWIQPLDNYNKVEDNKLKEYTNNIDIRDDNKANTQNEDVTTNNVTTLCCNKKAKYESMNPNSIRNMFILLRNKIRQFKCKKYHE